MARTSGALSESSGRAIAAPRSEPIRPIASAARARIAASPEDAAEERIPGSKALRSSSSRSAASASSGEANRAGAPRGGSGAPEGAGGPPPAHPAAAASARITGTHASRRRNISAPSGKQSRDYTESGSDDQPVAEHPRQSRVVDLSPG